MSVSSSCARCWWLKARAGSVSTFEASQNCEQKGRRLMLHLDVLLSSKTGVGSQGLSDHACAFLMYLQFDYRNPNVLLLKNTQTSHAKNS